MEATLNTTWQEMLDEPIVFSLACHLIHNSSLVQDLINRKILYFYRGSLNSQKPETTYKEDAFKYIFKSTDERITKNIILRLYQAKSTYFKLNAKNITVEDLIKYVCTVLSNYIMLDVLVKKLFTFNYQQSDFTFITKFFDHYAHLDSSSNVIIKFQYKLFDNKNNNYYDGFFHALIIAEYDAMYNMDCSVKNLSAEDFIRFNLSKTCFNIEIKYEKDIGKEKKVCEGTAFFPFLLKETKQLLGSSIKLI